MRLSHSMVDQLTVEAIQNIRARNLLKLGRGCLTHPRWKGQVTLSLMRAPELIAVDQPVEDQAPYWWKKMGVVRCSAFL